MEKEGGDIVVISIFNGRSDSYKSAAVNENRHASGACDWRKGGVRDRCPG